MSCLRTKTSITIRIGYMATISFYFRFLPALTGFWIGYDARRLPVRHDDSVNEASGHWNERSNRKTDASPRFMVGRWTNGPGFFRHGLFLTCAGSRLSALWWSLVRLRWCWLPSMLTYVPIVTEDRIISSQVAMPLQLALAWGSRLNRVSNLGRALVGGPRSLSRWLAQLSSGTARVSNAPLSRMAR